MAYYVYEVLDSERRLIYVGCTRDIWRRMEQHALESWWYDQIAKVRAQVYPNRDAARAEERRRIGEKHPRWNLNCLPPRRKWNQQHYHDFLTAKTRQNPVRPKPTLYKRIAVEYQRRFGADLMVPAALLDDRLHRRGGGLMPLIFAAWLLLAWAGYIQFEPLF